MEKITINTAPINFISGKAITKPEIGTIECVDNGGLKNIYVTFNILGTVIRHLML